MRGLAHSMIFEVHDAIERLPGSTSARELLMRRALEYVDRIASEPEADTSLQRELASAYIRIGNVQGYGGGANLGQQAAAIESLRKALAIRERLARAAPSDGAAQADLARVHLGFGGLLAGVGDGPAAMDHFRTAVSLNEKVVAAHPRDLAAQAELAWSYVALSDWPGDWQQSLSLLQKALPLFRRAADATPNPVRLQRGLATTYRRIGGFETAQNNYARGLEAYRSAQAIDERRLAAEPNSPEARLNASIDISEVAVILLALGDPMGALAECDRARSIREDLVRADPNDTRARLFLAEAIGRVASIRGRLGERAAALAAHRAALEHLDSLAAVMPANVSVQQMRADALADLGVGYALPDTGRPKGSRCGRARPFLVRALDAYRDLEQKGQLGADATARISELQTTLTRCAADR